MADVVTLITRDHREMQELFKQVSSGSSGRAEAFEKVCAMLLAHGHAEEKEVYPHIAKLSDQDKGEVRHSLDEHHEAERMVEQLRQIGVGGNGFDKMFNQLVEAVQEHIAEEERDLLPDLKQSVDADRLRQIGEAFLRRREAELVSVGRAS